MITVRLIGHIRAALGKDALTVAEESATVASLLTLIESDCASRGSQIVISKLNTLVVINGIEISSLNGLESKVEAGDEVVLIPVSHGG